MFRTPSTLNLRKYTRSCRILNIKNNSVTEATRAGILAVKSVGEPIFQFKL